MKKTILSLFILATLGITSCSSDSDAEVTQDNLVTNLIPNDQNYVRTGESDSKPILRLNQNDLTFSTTITGNGSNLVELSSDFKEIKVKANISPSNVGMKNISYTILRNGNPIGGSSVNFEVSFGRLDVTLKRLVVNSGFEIGGIDTNALYNNITIKNVPWQYVLDGTQETYKFQLVLVEDINGVEYALSNNFNQEQLSTAFFVCKLQTDYSVTNSFVEHRNVSQKKYNNDNFKILYELKVKMINDPLGGETTYEFITPNECNFYDSTPDTPNTFYFECTTI